jgi:hypothetical protein
MKLGDYLAARSESQMAFTERARRYKPDLSQSTVSKVVRGEGCVAAVAYALIRASQDEPSPDGGTVTLADVVGADAAA